MFVITYRKYFYAVSIILVLASIAAIGFWGLRPGIDFTGGSLVEVNYPNGRPEISAVKEKVSTLSFGELSVRESGNDAIIIRTVNLDETQKAALLSTLSSVNASSTPVVKQFTTVGPTLGKELEGRAAFSVILVILAIVLFIAFAFRHVSKPVSSFKYGLVAVIALVHDVILPLGFFAVLGHFHGTEIDSLVITAILVILGYSVNDTIVIFDRIRENLKHASDSDRSDKFQHIVGQSLSETFGRSINTSLTVIAALVALYFLGGDATRSFSLALLVGVVAGTYSSIFLAAPILVSLKKGQDKRRG